MSWFDPSWIFFPAILATIDNLIFEYSVLGRDICTGIHCTSIPKEGNREAYRNEYLWTTVLFFCLALKSIMTLVYLHECMAVTTLTCRVIPVTSGHLEHVDCLIWNLEVPCLRNHCHRTSPQRAWASRCQGPPTSLFVYPQAEVSTPAYSCSTSEWTLCPLKKGSGFSVWILIYCVEVLWSCRISV